MRYLLLIITACIALYSSTDAATLYARIVDQDGQAIHDANLIQVGTRNGTSSDFNGRAILQQLAAGTHRFEVSCIGYETGGIEFTFAEDEILTPVIVLNLTTLDLDEVEVTGHQPDGYDHTTPHAVERIDTAELETYSGGGGVLQAIGESSGVDNKPCALCGSSGVGLQGLDPSYTEIRIDGMALMSGVGSLYGLESVRTQSIESLELHRGSSDPTQGGGAVAGSVNLRSPRLAQNDTLQLKLALGDGYRHEVGLILEKNLLLPSRLDLNWSSDPLRIDHNNDRLTDTPQLGRLQGRLKQEAELLHTSWKWSLRGMQEQRFAGDIDWEESDRGSDAVYGRDIATRRFEATLSGEWQDRTGREWKLSQAWVQHNQDSWYGATPFDAGQKRGIVQLSAGQSSLNSTHRLETGFTWERYEDNLQLGVPTDRLDRVPHVYYYYSRQLRNDLQLAGGIRTEHHAGEGLIPLLRGALRWQLPTSLNMQLSAGQAFRQINLFSLNKAVHAGFDGITLAEQLDPERSLAVNYAVNWEQVSQTASYLLKLNLFTTEFRDKAVLAYTAEEGVVAYSNASRAWSRGFTLSKDINWLNGWRSRMNYNWARVRYLQDDVWQEEHMVNRWTASFRLDRTFAAIDLHSGLKWKVFGPQRLPEGRSRDESPVWHTVDLNLNKRFTSWQLGLAVDNLLDWTQPDSPFIEDADGYLIDSAMVYGPLIGRRFRLQLSVGW